MLVSGYESEEEEPEGPKEAVAVSFSSFRDFKGISAKEASAVEKPAEQSKPPATGDAAPAAAAAAKVGAGPAGDGTAKRLPALKLKEQRKEIRDAKSATAVVQMVRRCLDNAWSFIWGAEALYQIAKRSTARTRKEWVNDPTVMRLGKKLVKEASSSLLKSGKGGDRAVDEEVDVILLALEALKRLAMQDAPAQKDVLERSLACLVADKWRHPVKSLSRLYWLGAPLKLKSPGEEFSSLLPAELRARAQELDGPDIALLLAAFRKEGARDAALLEKVAVRLRAQGVLTGVSATDLVEMSEAMNVLGVRDEQALRPLGQEVLRRRGELSPDESHRVHTAFQTMKLPLPQVWTQVGAATKREGSEIVTSQAFAPQEGHEKRRRGNHDIERTSPPRVVRDYKMMSY